MDNKFEIRYLSGDTEKTVEVNLCFLSLSKRAEIIKLDVEHQKALKKLQKDYKSVIAAEKKLQDKMADKDDMEKLQEFANIDDKELQARGDFIAANSKLSDEGDIKLFQTIVNKYKLSDDGKKLIYGPLESDFWQNVDLAQVKSINSSFRKDYSV